MLNTDRELDRRRVYVWFGSTHHERQGKRNAGIRMNISQSGREIRVISFLMAIDVFLRTFMVWSYPLAPLRNPFGV